MYRSQILEIKEASFETDKKEVMKGYSGKIIRLDKGNITPDIRPFWVGESSQPEDYQTLSKAKNMDIIDHIISYDGKKVRDITLIPNNKLN
ncbi:hypothetical protein [Spiroplasma endosymbiont of Diplazon laetatorius]|uniref:hypothetical protein n=1 Tax=Spiroplasma endosymbiont of Diplazon laetatorius TaxID=3066322 RepID=UPI0030CDF292